MNIQNQSATIQQNLQKKASLKMCPNSLFSVNGREFIRSKTLPSIPIHQILGQEVIGEYGTPISVRSTNTSPTALARIHHSKSSGSFRGKPPKTGFYLPGEYNNFMTICASFCKRVNGYSSRWNSKNIWE